MRGGWNEYESVLILTDFVWVAVCWIVGAGVAAGPAVAEAVEDEVVAAIVNC